MIAKNLLIGALAGLAVLVQADVVDLPRLPTADRLDTEVVLDWPFNRTRQDVRDFNFDLAFVGTPSNNVEVALGRDDDGDGKLSFADTWEEVPSWIYDPSWNLMRLTARGMDEPEDIFVVQVDYRS